MIEAGSLLKGLTVLERGWLSANNILLVSEDRAALVDSGYCTHAKQTLQLVEASLQGRPLDLLLNTHLHADHCGGNAALQRGYPALQTLIPPGLTESVRVWDQVALLHEPLGQQCPRFTFDGLLRPGTRLRLADTDWEVHGAPGHDPHSVMLFEPVSRILLSADALWENGFGVIFPELEGEDAFSETASTLDHIERLDARLVVPGHGRVFRDVRAALANARRRLDGLARNPVKHARHAAKVLLKFKLLEEQSMREDALMTWVERTTYFGLIHQQWFRGATTREWMFDLIQELEHSGALRREQGGRIVNA